MREAGLYERLIVDGWRGLDESVRRLHAAGVRVTGSFTVRRGASRTARMLASLLRLPAPGEVVPVQLRVTPSGDGERWHRTFNNRAFVTQQHAHDAALLAERMGPFEVRFRLCVEDGALVYQQESAALRALGLRVTLPAALSPRIEASEHAESCDGRAGGVRVSVRVTMPLVGLLLLYEGRLLMEVNGA